MSILIHTCSFPSSIRVAACQPPPLLPLHDAKQILQEEETSQEVKDFEIKIFLEEEAFARRNFCKKKILREEFILLVRGKSLINPGTETRIDWLDDSKQIR